MRMDHATEVVEANDCNLSGSTFRGVNLSRARLDDVNLAGAEIRNVSLREAQLSDVNLSGAAIRDCNTDGLTINGILVADLLAAYAASR